MSGQGHFKIDVSAFRDKFDREPIDFLHDLSGLDVFQGAALHELAEMYDAHPLDHFVSGGAASAATEFFTVPRGQCKPSEALTRLDTGDFRILLKRPENHHAGFRRLLDQLFAEIMSLRGGLRGESLVRLESAVFITSAATTTPFHFDPEIGFFSQIEGEKIYHVYSPRVLRDADLERFYLQGEINIGQVDLRACDPALEVVYNLAPGVGFHQPQNSPHWVETRASRSVSYSFVYETDASRARGNARACNYYLRKFGLEPVTPGRRPAADAVKAATMRMLIPVRKQVSATLRSIRGR